MKKLVAIGLVMAMMMSIMACSSSEERTSSDTKDSNGNVTETQNTGEVDKSQQLIIYTNSGGDGRDSWLKKIAAENGYNIEVVSIQAADLSSRVIAEKNNPQADLIFGLNAIEYEKLKKEKVLQQWEPTWAEEVSSYQSDKEGYYYPTVLQPLVNIMSMDLQNPPKDYTDLINPEWKDKYTMFSFGGGTGKTILASLLIRYKDETGEYGISEEGWEFVENWIQNGHIAADGEDYLSNLINNIRPISEMWGSGVIQYQTERNYKFQILVPEIGVPFVTEQVAIINESKKKDLAIDFANWFGSSELQAEWTKQFGTIPCQPKALEVASDDVKELMNLLHPQDIDWNFVAENIDQWVEKCELEYVK